VQIGGVEPQTGSVIHLNAAENKIVADSLAKELAKQKAASEPFADTEHLLRRVTGRIIEFVRSAGERPVELSDRDIAVLAVHEGNTKEFADVLPNIADIYGDLLIQAAALPSAAGREMTQLLIETAGKFDSDVYLQACKNAVDTGDFDRVVYMVSKAQGCVTDLDEKFHSEVIFHSAFNHDEKHGGKSEHVAVAVVEQCTPEQIQNLNPLIVEFAAMHSHNRLAYKLIERGAHENADITKVIYNAAMNGNSSVIYRLKDAGVDIDGDNHAALRLCVDRDCLRGGLTLMSCGADFPDFYSEVMKESTNGRKLSRDEIEFLNKMWSHCPSELKPQEILTDMENDDEDDMEL
jgi:hypothetical protein